MTTRNEVGPLEPCPHCGCCPPHMDEAARIDLARLAGVAEERERWEERLDRLKAAREEFNHTAEGERYRHMLARVIDIMEGREP